jgi:hypothetical protein
MVSERPIDAMEAVARASDGRGDVVREFSAQVFVCRRFAGVHPGAVIPQVGCRPEVALR